MIDQLEWKRIESEEVSLPEPETVYTDELPLTNILVSPDGATSCLRRMPGEAEVIAWPYTPGGVPTSWTGPPSLPVLETFGFDGTEIYARTEHAILRIRNGTVETVHETRRYVYQAALSPDAKRIAWREKGDGMLGFTADCGNRLKPVRVAILDYCYGLAWLSSDELVVVVLHHVADAEAAMSIEFHAAQGTAIATLLKTDQWNIQLSATDPTNRTVYFSARSSRRQSLGGRDGVWLLDVDRRRATCLANATPAGGTVAVLQGRCLYANGAVQTSETSTLVSAGIGQSRNAKVFGFLRDFAVSAAADAVYYRQRRANGPTAIGRMSIGELTKPWGVASGT